MLGAHGLQIKYCLNAQEFSEWAQTRLFLRMMYLDYRVDRATGHLHTSSQVRNLGYLQRQVSSIMTLIPASTSNFFFFTNAFARLLLEYHKVADCENFCTIRRNSINMLALWLGLTACLALARAGPPPDPDDPYVLQLPSSLIDDAAREKILKPCNDPLVQTIDQDPVAVWEGLGCYELHGVLDYDWYINQNNTKYSYVEYEFPCRHVSTQRADSVLKLTRYLSDRMHGPANWRCHHIDNGPCNNPNVQCHQTEFACG